MKVARYRTALFGLGRIGAGYHRVNGRPRNHFDAIIDCGEMELVAAIDTDSHRRNCVARHRPEKAARIYSSLKDAIVDRVDIGVIATPPSARIDPIQAVLEAGASVIIVEKPLARSLQEALAIVQLIASYNAVLKVNFHRRYDSSFQAIKQHATGDFVAGQARYGKGLHNYGSHLIDLLTEWCGPPVVVRALDELSRDCGDPTLSFQVSFEDDKTCLVLGLPDTDYDVFDVDLMFRDRRIEFAAGGAVRKVWTCRDSLYYPGYTHLETLPCNSFVGALSGLKELYSSIVSFLQDGIEILGCDADAAVRGMATTESILRSARNNCEPVVVGNVLP
ncbi:MAG: Gfo/Idh/MocA family oxidoreductase [Pseudomonadota bacterium]